MKRPWRKYLTAEEARQLDVVLRLKDITRAMILACKSHSHADCAYSEQYRVYQAEAALIRNRASQRARHAAGIRQKRRRAA